MYLAVAIESHLSKAKDYYILNMSDSEFTLVALEELVSGSKIIQLAASHSTGAVVFMSLDGTLTNSNIPDN